MTASLTGINSNIADIVATNRTHAGRPVFEVRTKLGASLAGTAGALDIGIRRVNPDGGAATIAVPANVITPAPLAMANPFITMPENPVPGSILGQLTASGGVGTKVYGLGSGHNGALSISPTGLVSVAANVLGELAVPAVWNFEAGSSFTAPVQVTDNTGTTAATLTITLTNVNEAPSAANLNVLVRDSQTGNNSVITPLSVISDPDAGSTHTVTIFSGNAAGYFAISGSNLVSTQAVPAGTSTILTMRIVDNGGLISFYTISVAVISALIQAASYLVAQSRTVGTTIATFPSTDAVGELVTYTILPGGSSSFALSGRTLSIASLLSRAVQPSHTLQIQASTSGTTDVATITITVVSDPVLSGPSTFVINEGLPGGTVVGQITVDQGGDPNTQLTVSNGGDLFTVSPGGVITTREVLNHPANDSFVDIDNLEIFIIISATNINSPTVGDVTHNVTVEVVNIKVLLFEAQSFSVPFGSSNGDSIGTLSISRGTPPYTFAESTTSSAISVNAQTGELFVQDETQFELVGGSLTIGVTATDSGSSPNPPQVVTRTITVNVGYPPISVSGGPFNIDENLPIGTTVGQLSIQSGNALGVTAQLLNPGSEDFTIDNLGVIKTAVVLDFERKSSYNFLASIENSASQIYDAEVVITVNNLLDFTLRPATDFVVPSRSLELSDGTIVGPAFALSTSILNATVAGPSDAQVLFTINSTTNCQFRLNGVQTTTFTRANIIAGSVGFTATMNSTAANYLASLDSLVPSFTFTVSDTGATGVPSRTATITPVFSGSIVALSVTGVGPILGQNMRAISIGSTPGQINITVQFQVRCRFELASNPGVGVTTWTQDQVNAGVIQLVRTQAGNMQFGIRASGANGILGVAESLLSIADLLAISVTSFNIAENPAANAVIGTLSVTGGTTPYTFSESTPSSAIAVNPSTGVLTVQDAAQFNHETSPTLTVGVTVSDSSSPAQSITRTITVNVTDVGPTLDLDDYFVEVADNANTSSPILLTSMSFNLEGVATLSLQSNPHISLANVTATSANLMLTQTVLSSISSPFAVQVRLLSIANSSVLLFDTFTLTIVGGGY
jgi:hypothetical protein